MHCTWSCLKTIRFSTELNKEEPNCTVLLQSLWQSCSKQHLLQSEPWKIHVRTNFRFDEDQVVLLPESSLPLLRVGVSVVYKIENYFPNIELFYFLQFMPVVKLVRLFEDLLISYLYRQKLSSQDGFQMRKIH